MKGAHGKVMDRNGTLKLVNSKQNRKGLDGKGIDRTGRERNGMALLTKEKIMEALAWPLDAGTLKKGDTISKGLIGAWAGVDPDSKQYELKLLAFQAWLDKRLEDMDRIWTTYSVNGDLHIATDYEASVYNARRQRSMVRGIIERHHRQLAVDISQIPAEDTHAHERRVASSAFLMHALRTARKKINQINQVNQVTQNKQLTQEVANEECDVQN